MEPYDVAKEREKRESTAFSKSLDMPIESSHSCSGMSSSLHTFSLQLASVCIQNSVMLRIELHWLQTQVSSVIERKKHR